MADEKNVHDQVLDTAQTLNSKVDDLQDKAADFAEDVAQKAQAVADSAAKHGVTLSKTVRTLLKVMGWIFFIYGIIRLFASCVLVSAEVYVAAKGVMGELADESGLTQFTLILTTIQFVLLLVSSLAMVIIGRALIKDNRRRVALITPWLLFCTVVSLAVSYMVGGPSAISVSGLVEIIFLLVLSVAIDPSLAAERIAEHKQEVAEDHAAAAKGMLGRDLSGKGYMRIDFFNCFWIFFVPRCGSAVFVCNRNWCSASARIVLCKRGCGEEGNREHDECGKNCHNGIANKGIMLKTGLQHTLVFLFKARFWRP